MAQFLDYAGLQDYHNKITNYIDSKEGGGQGSFKGTVESKEDLPADAKIGDSYKVNDEKALYIKEESQWTKVASEGDFTIGDEELNHSVDIKTYIDSRIFVGDQAAVDEALAAGTIDDSTFVVLTDDEGEELAPIGNEYIESLFDK